MQAQTDWTTGPEAWAEFVAMHPELGYRNDRWAFYNFLRHYKRSLVNQDAMRRARHRLWIAHRRRFTKFAFECATGKAALLASPADVSMDLDELSDAELRQILRNRIEASHEGAELRKGVAEMAATNEAAE